MINDDTILKSEKSHLIYTRALCYKVMNKTNEAE